MQLETADPHARETGMRPAQLFEPDFFANPYPPFFYLRHNAPIYWNAQGNFWIVSRYDEVAAMLADPRFVLNLALWEGAPQPPEGSASAELRRDFSSAIITRGGRDHTRLRKLIGAAFSIIATDWWRHEVNSIVDECLDRWMGQSASGASDVCAGFTKGVPVRVIARLLGIPDEFHEQFFRLSRLIINAWNPGISEDVAHAGVTAINELNAYLTTRIFDCPHRVGKFLTALIDARDGTDGLSTEDILSLCRTLLVAGSETTFALMNVSLLTLVENPGLAQQLRSAPDRIPDFVTEVLRYECPVNMIVRVARADAEYRGTLIRKGQLVMVAIASANRDESHYPEADKFNLDRKSRDGLAFGLGAHFCVGSPAVAGPSFSLIGESTQGSRFIPERLSGYISTIEPRLDPILFPPKALQSIRAVASTIPGGVSRFFGFECPLGEGSPRADFLACITGSNGERETLRDFGLFAPETGCCTVDERAWDRLRKFARVWSQAGSPFDDAILNLWVEFDLDRSGGFAIPNVFLGPKPFIAGQHAETLLDALERLAGSMVQPAVRIRVQQSIQAVPPPAEVFQIGAMRARTPAFARVCVRGLSANEIRAYLIAVGWPGDAEDLEPVLNTLSHIGDRIDLNLDVAEAIQERTGFEVSFIPKWPPKEPLWLRFLDFLAERGLCATSQRRAIMSFPGELMSEEGAMLRLGLNHAKLTWSAGSG